MRTLLGVLTLIVFIASAPVAAWISVPAGYCMVLAAFVSQSQLLYRDTRWLCARLNNAITDRAQCHLRLIDRGDIVWVAQQIHAAAVRDEASDEVVKAAKALLQDTAEPDDKSLS